MTTAYPELIVGAYGWDHVDWQGVFYPDDLPEDWRLTYYANEFRSVYVPQSVWLHASMDDIEEWADGTPDEFYFFLELKGNNGNAKFTDDVSQRIKIFDEKLHGIIAHDASMVLPDVRCYYDAGYSDPAAGEHGHVCWRPGYPARLCDVALMDSASQQQDQKALAQMIRTYLDQTGPCEVAWLFFEGSPAISALHETVTIAQLLGA